MQYRTEVEIPHDHYVCLLLPSHLPAGRATITVTLHEPDAPGAGVSVDDDPDRQDIEWWEEFEDDREPVGR